MDWKQVGEQVGKFAPILGGVLGGPGGAALGGLVAAALGVGNNAGEVAAAITGNPDAILKLRELESTERVRLNEIAMTQAVETIKAETADRASARQMQVATQSRMPAFLALMMTAGVFALLGLFAIKGVPKDESGVLMLMVGSLLAAWGGSVTFYFGTTSSSQIKTNLLAQRSA